MSVTLQSAPPAPESKKDFFRLPPFPAEGPTVLTVLAYNFIKDYINQFDEEPTPYPAVEFFLGAETEKGVGFVKTWPSRYSLHEKANYAKLYKLATGKAPVAGSKPDDMIGCGLTATVTNTAKTSKTGKQYTVSSAKDFGAVHPKLKGEIAPVKELLPKLKAVLASNDDKAAEPDSNDNPF